MINLNSTHVRKNLAGGGTKKYHLQSSKDWRTNVVLQLRRVVSN
nr:MAG TPA: hypothetical protein [Caudoviricetes sp.]